MSAVRLAVAAVGAALLASAPAGADRFEPDPTNCSYTTHHVFQHGDSRKTEIRVTYTSQRYSDCDTARAVAHSYASTAGCHDTRYCHVHGGSFSCKNTFYSHSKPIAHCQALGGGSGEVFMSWHRIDG